MQDFATYYPILGPLSAFMASVTWAVGSIGYTRLSRGHSPFAINFARATVALPLCVAVVCIAMGGPEAAWQSYKNVPLEKIGWLGVSILASYGLGDVFFMWSARSLGVPAALAISSSYPVLTAIYGAIAQGEGLGLRQSAGLLLTVGGVIAVILSQGVPTPASGEGSHGAPSRLTSKRTGVWLAFGAMFCWALNSIGTSRGGQELHPMVVNSFRMTFALALTAAFGQIFSRGSEITIPWRVLKKNLHLFVFEAFGGSAFFAFGLSHSSLAAGATLSSLAPVLSVPLAWATGMERFSLQRTLGVCVTAGGLCLLLL